jgi:YD repeat-containing protein
MPDNSPTATSPQAPRGRRLFALAGTVILTLTISLMAAIWAGPLISGALFLSWPTGEIPVSHNLPDSYELKHKGHIDESTGLYVREDEDLVLRHTPPFIVTRTYLSGDRVSRQFGVGATDNAEWYLIGELSDLSWAELILADGGRIRFERVSHGNFIQNALFVHRSTPTGFYGSQLGWAGLDWVLRFRDGGLARFQGCGPNTGTLCSLTLLRDEDGHILRFHRDLGGRLNVIEAPTERIAFEYDDHGRIVRASDGAGHRLAYSYDTGGRLVRVADADGTVRSYTYSAKDEMLTISEPGWFIENTFDAGGRVTRQVTLMSGSAAGNQGPREYVIEFAYKVSGGSVVETNVKEYDGTHTVVRFNAQRYVETEIHDAEGKEPVTVSIDRDPIGQFPTGASVTCTVGGRPVSGRVLVNGDEEQAKHDLIRRTCSPKD